MTCDRCYTNETRGQTISVKNDDFTITFSKPRALCSSCTDEIVIEVYTSMSEPAK